MSKNKTVNVDAVKRDVKKLVEQTSSKGKKFGSGSAMELSPGSVTRQSVLEQEMGTKNYRNMIHGHNDKNRNFLDSLPFTFPRKKLARSNENVALVCPKCDTVNVGTELTLGLICVKCKKYSSVSNYRREELYVD